MIQDKRWSTQYKGFTITQRHGGTYYAAAHTYDTLSDTNKSKLYKQINQLLK